jgi:hypothetical protein
MARFEPLWQQAGSYAAQLDRVLIAALWPSGGVLGGAVTAVFATMNVSIAAGYAAVPLQTGQGSALCRWDAAEVVTLTASPPSGQSRIDLIVAQLRDNAIDGGPNNDFIFSAVAGTPAATNPAVPATPANALALATVTVAGAIANLNAAPVVRVSPPMTPGSNPYVARLHRTAALNAVGNVLIMPYDTATYDPNGNAVTGAAAGYRVPVPGRYLVTSRVGVGGITSNTRGYQSIMRNGAEVSRGNDIGATSGFPLGIVISDVVTAAAGDLLQIQNYCAGNGLPYEIGTLLNYAAFSLQAWP